MLLLQFLWPSSCQFQRTVNGVRRLSSQHKLSSWIIFFIRPSGESASSALELSLTSTHHRSTEKHKRSPQTSLSNITPLIQIPHLPLVWRRGRSGKRERSHETDLPVWVKGAEGKDAFALHWAAWRLCSDHEWLKSWELWCITVVLWRKEKKTPAQNLFRNHFSVSFLD